MSTNRHGVQNLISIDELKEIANGQIRAIVQHILPNGRENCGYWEVGSIAGEQGQSLKVNLNGGMRGMWTDFSAAKGSPQRGGNVIQLVAQVNFGGNVGKACQWLRSWLGLDNLPPDRLAKQKAEAAKQAEISATNATEKAERNRRRAHALYINAVPYAGTIAEAYMVARGLDFRKAGLNAPGAIRFHPEVYCAETGTKLPAMLAPIIALDGRHLGTHRTWLAADGSGKAMLSEAKKSIGKYQGGFIPLWKGEHDTRWKDTPQGTPIYVSEGIEDGYSAVLARPSIRCIAGVSLSNMGSLELPPHCPIHILGQRDEKMQAIEAFEAAVARLQERGHAVFLIYPPVGYKDYNDVLRGTPRELEGGSV
jgi:hypothetical protein